MKEIKEVIDLPPVETQPLVHPLDIPAARKPYRLFEVEGVDAGVAGGRVGAGIDVEAFR